MTYSSAYRHWYRALVRNNDKTIEHILLGLMQDTGGLDILINRNPSLNYGSLMKMKCVGINHNYTMSVSLLILAPLSADQNQGQFYIVIYKINNSELLG